jgi:4-diphosphocytidyl-2-C-methyl-D-erythritol kinase
MMKTYSRQTPGKINLFLEIKGKRSDSWHEILTLFYPVKALSDRVELSFGGEGIRIECPNPGVPLDEDNLMAKAAKAFYAAAGQPCPGMTIRLEKKLPVAGGMGGGSSDAGAVLDLLQQHSGIELSPEKLAQAALSVGSDVPFFLNPVPSVGRGRGEILQETALPENLPLLLIPGVFPISAAWAYRHWQDVPRSGRYDLDALLKALSAGDYAAAGGLLCNDLEGAAVRKFPLLARFFSLLRESGGAPLMSGSGSTVFALYPGFAERDRAFEDLKNEISQYDAVMVKS